MIPAAAYATRLLQPTFLDRVHPAIRLGGLVLGIAGCLIVGPAFLLATVVCLSLLLQRTGLPLSSQVGSLRPWIWAAGLVLLIHTVSSTEFAPLWQPSFGGFLAGCEALVRVAGTLAWLGLFVRTSTLQEWVTAARWWLQPLARIGLPTEHLGLVLAVALGTVPGVLAEGRRIETVLRLRRQGPDSKSTRGLWQRTATRFVDRVRIVAPLLETLARRAESLSLSLRSRYPQADSKKISPPPFQILILALWLIALIWWSQGMSLVPQNWGL